MEVLASEASVATLFHYRSQPFGGDEKVTVYLKMPVE